MILRNLLRRKARTSLTVIGIAIGVAAIVALGVMAEGMRAGYAAMARGSQADLVLSQKGTMDITMGGVAAAALRKLREAIAPNQITVVPLTGSGLKIK